MLHIKTVIWAFLVVSEGEFFTIMSENVAADKQVCCWSSDLELVYDLQLEGREWERKAKMEMPWGFVTSKSISSDMILQICLNSLFFPNQFHQLTFKNKSQWWLFSRKSSQHYFFYLFIATVYRHRNTASIYAYI